MTAPRPAGDGERLSCVCGAQVHPTDADYTAHVIHLAWFALRGLRPASPPAGAEDARTSTDPDHAGYGRPLPDTPYGPRTDTAERLADAITDLCWKATPYGGGDTVSAYLLPAGTVHRLIGAAQSVGIPAAFRAIPPLADPEEPPMTTECQHEWVYLGTPGRDYRECTRCGERKAA